MRWSALPIVSEVGTLESWQPRAIVLLRCSAEPVFSIAVLFDIFVCTALVGELHHGIQTAVMHYLVPIIHSFDRLRSTFGMKGQLPTRLPTLTAQ
jgi:hypothetical protein